MGTQVMQHHEWTETFRQAFENAIERYQAGERHPEQMVLPTGANFLASIGSTPHELFDYVEDWCEDGEPPFETVLAIAAIRYEYFVSVQHGARSPRLLSADSFISGADCLGGFRWLPRIIAKARAKLHGELPPELMYGCGADRAFLKRISMSPEEFLRLVLEAGDEDGKILAVVEQSAGSDGPLILRGSAGARSDHEAKEVQGAAMKVARTPEETHKQFIEAMNAEDLDSLLSFYEPEAVLVPQPGQPPVVGKEAIREVLQGFLRLQPHLEVKATSIIHAADVALVRSTWRLTGTGVDGMAVDMTHRSTDVMHRQPDGMWRILIDHPFGAD